MIPPPCVLSMGCLCAGHARGTSPDMPCCTLEAELPAFDHEEIADRLFGDSVVGRMLRRVCERGSMDQVDVMREYHVRCERPRPSRSSYACQFGRFSTDKLDHEIAELARTFGTSPSFHHAWSRIVLRQIDHPHLRNRRVVVWRGPHWTEILRRISDASLEDHFVALEAQMLDPRKTDSVDDTRLWLMRVRAEQEHRSNVQSTTFAARCAA